MHFWFIQCKELLLILLSLSVECSISFSKKFKNCFSVQFVLFYQAEIVVLKEEEGLQPQEGQEPDQVVVLSSLRGSLTLRAPMLSLTKKKLKRRYNKNFMITLGSQMR